MKYRRRLSRNEASVRLALHWWTLLQYLKLITVRLGIVKLAATIVAFLASVAVLPLIAIIYIGLRSWRYCVQIWVWYYLKENLDIHPISIESNDSSDTPLSTLLLCLRGTLDVGDIQDKIQEIIEDRDRDGHLMYPNLRCHLEEVYGYYVWRKDCNFDLQSHISLAPDHFHGRSISNRNIQEYLSELCSEPIREGMAPWVLVVIQGVDESGSAVTWFAARAHPLLVDSLAVQDIIITKYPNPWSAYHQEHNSFWSGEENNVPIFSAPAATKQLIKVTLRSIFNWSLIPIKTFYRFTMIETESVMSKLNEIVHSFSISLFYDILFIKRQYNVFLCLLQVSDVISHLPFRLHQHLIDIIRIIQPLKQIIKCCRVNLFLVLKKLVLWIVEWLTEGICNLRNIDKSYLDLVQHCSIEIYWVIRAFVSLPRLLLEEIILIYNAKPLSAWNKRSHQRRRNKVNIFWSEEVSLNSVSSVKGVTGASLSSVLLTATAGAVRDLVRACGSYPPDNIQCTLPLYSPTRHHNSSYGLLPLALPTGSPSVNCALRSVRTSLRKMRKYPERYLASIWLIRHIIDFLPRPLRSVIFKRLSAAHPLLLTNLIAPKQTLQLWGHDVSSVMYWRPPQHHAVVSVCVSSYCDHVTAGVVVDASKISYANIIPQAFVTHLNELAFEAGVKIERKKTSKGFRRHSTPFATPDPTPPSTPTLRKASLRLGKADNYFTFSPEDCNNSLVDCRLNESLESICSTGSTETVSSSISSCDSTVSLLKHRRTFRRRKSGISSNSWEILKQTIKGL